jgi:hypothetical protein
MFSEWRRRAITPRTRHQAFLLTPENRTDENALRRRLRVSEQGMGMLCPTAAIPAHDLALGERFIYGLDDVASAADAGVIKPAGIATLETSGNAALLLGMNHILNLPEYSAVGLLR